MIGKMSKRARKILIIFFSLAIVLLVKLFILSLGTMYATVDGYYEPLTINFNRDNTFSLFDMSLINSLESISLPEYSVKSLYPQAYIKLSRDNEKKLCYVWRLKLRKRVCDSYLSSLDKFMRIKVFHINYPIPKEYQYYDIPNKHNLILALSSSRYVYLIQIKCLNSNHEDDC